MTNKRRKSVRKPSQSSQRSRKSESASVDESAPPVKEDELPKPEVPTSAKNAVDRRKPGRGEQEGAAHHSKKTPSSKKKREKEAKSPEPKPEEPLHQDEEMVVDEPMEEGDYQPRSLRLRLCRQDDGNLSVIDGKPQHPQVPSSQTEAQRIPSPPPPPPPPTSKSLKLRLTLTPPKVTTEVEKSTSTTWASEILAAAFPETKANEEEELLPPKKKSRSSKMK